jgi:hypothetical protein
VHDKDTLRVPLYVPAGRLALGVSTLIMYVADKTALSGIPAFTAMAFRYVVFSIRIGPV